MMNNGRSTERHTMPIFAQTIARIQPASAVSPARQGKRDPVFLFLILIAAYVVLQTLTMWSLSGLLKAFSFAFAFGLFLVMLVVSAFLPSVGKRSLGFGFTLALYYYGFVASVFFNSDALDYGTTIKMAMAPLFLLFGASFESQNQFRSWRLGSTRWLLGLMLVLPFALWIWQLASGQITFGGLGYVSIFANRNNAGLYVVTLIALLNVLREQPLRNVLIYLVAAVAFGTLGVLLAVLMALVIAIGGRRAVLILAAVAFAASAAVFFVPVEFGIFARFKPVVDSILLIANGTINIGTVTYGELVGRLQTTDLSFVFRLKHWFDLLGIFAAAPLENWLFGFGVGSSTRLSEAGLVPHNDYLRILFECGVVAFAGFVSTIAMILYRCGRRWEAVPLITVAIYFFSENLIDNFVAMSVFFFCSGALAYRLNKERGALK
jgi:O-antigen ligase